MSRDGERRGAFFLPLRDALAGLAVVVMLVMSATCVPARAGNLALTAGRYGATLGAGGAVASERNAFGQTPASLNPGRAGFHLHLHRPFGMEEIGVGEAGAFWDLKQWGFSFTWRQTRVEDLYSESLLSPGLAFRPTAFRAGTLSGWTLGASLEGQRSDLGDAYQVNWSYSLGCAWHPHPRIRLGLFGKGLPAPESAIIQGGLEVASEPDGSSPAAQSVNLDFRKTGEARWRALASWSINLGRGVQASAAFSTPGLQISLGLKIRYGGLGFDHAYRFHRPLGRTSLSSLEFSRPWRGGGPAP